MELIILSLLMIKHYYVDFVHQTVDHVTNKGIYGHPKGLEHSAWHGFFTVVIFCIWFPFSGALFVGLVDFFLHYHIDYFKMKYGEKDSTTKQYWKHFGLDQLAHNLTYIFLIILTIGI